MNYLLDTDICIYLIRKKPPERIQKFNAYVVGDIGISSISVAELQFGVQKSRQPDQNQLALEQFLIPLIVVDFDYEAALVYGRISAALESKGTPIGALDTLIAAHALTRGLMLITNNTKEFARIPNLKIVDWVHN